MKIGLRNFLPIVAVSFLAAGQAGAIDQWPATGQTLCYDAAGAVINCDNTGQDGEFVDIRIPRSYTKLAADGSELAADATDHVMVRDNVTGLIWEVKIDDANSIHHFEDRYTWWDGTNGTEDDGTHANTLEFLTELNGAAGGAYAGTGFGGHTDWRLPTPDELNTLVDASKQGPAIDDYFHSGAGAPTGSCQTDPAYHWTSTVDKHFAVEALAVTFYSGKTVGRTRTTYTVGDAGTTACAVDEDPGTTPHDNGDTCDAEALSVRAVRDNN